MAFNTYARTAGASQATSGQPDHAIILAVERWWKKHPALGGSSVRPGSTVYVRFTQSFSPAREAAPQNSAKRFPSPAHSPRGGGHCAAPIRTCQRAVRTECQKETQGSLYKDYEDG